VSILKQKNIDWVSKTLNVVPEDISDAELCALCLTIITERTEDNRAALSAAMMLPITLSRALGIPSEEMAVLFRQTAEMMQAEAEREAQEQFH
jgi:hypothetical protein